MRRSSAGTWIVIVPKLNISSPRTDSIKKRIISHFSFFTPYIFVQIADTLVVASANCWGNYSGSWGNYFVQIVLTQLAIS